MIRLIEHYMELCGYKKDELDYWLRKGNKDMGYVSTTKLFAYLISNTGCTFDEVKEFFDYEMEFFDQPNSYYVDEDGDEVYVSDSLYEYIQEKADLDPSLIGNLIASQSDVVDDDVSLAEEFMAVYNLVIHMYQCNFYELQEEFYNNSVEYFEGLCEKIMEEDHDGVGQKGFIQFYMKNHHFELDEDGYYVDSKD